MATGVTGAAVVLLSGGLDSATAAAWARRHFDAVDAVTFRYGQRHEVEIDLAAELAERLALRSHRVLDLPLGRFGGSALTDPDMPVPEQAPDPARIPSTYVPARNLVFLAVAASLAESRRSGDLVIGANAVDFSGYPDCRRPFFDAFERTLAAGTKAGAEQGGASWRVHTPLIDLEKAEIIRMGLEFGVPYASTSSCYRPDSEGRPCGRCESCRIRHAGFAAAGVVDPLTERFPGPA